MDKKTVEIPVDDLYIPGWLIKRLATKDKKVCHFYLSNGAGCVILRNDQIIDLTLKCKSLEKQLTKAKGVNYAIIFAAFCTLTIVLAKKLKKKIKEENEEIDVWIKDKLDIVSPSNPNKKEKGE